MIITYKFPFGYHQRSAERVAIANDNAKETGDKLDRKGTLKREPAHRQTNNREEDGGFRPDRRRHGIFPRESIFSGFWFRSCRLRLFPASNYRGRASLLYLEDLRGHSCSSRYRQCCGGTPGHHLETEVRQIVLGQRITSIFRRASSSVEAHVIQCSTVCSLIT